VNKMKCTISPTQKIRNKARDFERRDVHKSMRQLVNSPKGYDGYVASKRPTCKFGKPFYKVFPYSWEPHYTRDSTGKVVKTEYRKNFYGRDGVEWVKRKPPKRLYEITKESEFQH
jgi:hypothetical protein